MTASHYHIVFAVIIIIIIAIIVICRGLPYCFAVIIFIIINIIIVICRGFQVHGLRGLRTLLQLSQWTRPRAPDDFQGLILHYLNIVWCIDYLTFVQIRAWYSDCYLSFVFLWWSGAPQLQPNEPSKNLVSRWEPERGQDRARESQREPEKPSREPKGP